MPAVANMTHNIKLNKESAPVKLLILLIKANARKNVGTGCVISKIKIFSALMKTVKII